MVMDADLSLANIDILLGLAPGQRHGYALLKDVEALSAGRLRLSTGTLYGIIKRLLADGFAARTKDLSDGTRQIMEVHVAGDFTDLHGFPLKRLDHDIAALSPATIAWVPHAALRQITEGEPHLTRLLWLSTLLDAAIQRERILSIGRRPALARIAHLFCELRVRLGAVGLADEGGYALSLTQTELADATGLTPVHVNRMLRELRELGCLTFRNGRVTYGDMARLIDLAEYDPAYLDAMASCIGWTVEKRLPGLPCPVLVLAADADYTPVAHKEAYTALMPHAQLVVIDDARHALPAERPDAFNAALRDFLATQQE